MLIWTIIYSSLQTFCGLGSSIFLINFLALVENQAGQEKSALEICIKSQY